MHSAEVNNKELREYPPVDIGAGNAGFIVSHQEAIRALRARHGSRKAASLTSVLPLAKYFRFSGTCCLSRRENRKRKRKK
jgi:hypothetical protein